MYSYVASSYGASRQLLVFIAFEKAFRSVITSTVTKLHEYINIKKIHSTSTDAYKNRNVSLSFVNFLCLEKQGRVKGAKRWKANESCFSLFLFK